MFYERSDSLVGVCKDVGACSSRTLTLDLTKFDKKEDKKKRKRSKSKEPASKSPSKSPAKKIRTTRSGAAEEEEGEED